MTKIMYKDKNYSGGKWLVDTEDILDEAVTNEKIDWSSIPGLVGVGFIAEERGLPTSTFCTHTFSYMTIYNSKYLDTGVECFKIKKAGWYLFRTTLRMIDDPLIHTAPSSASTYNVFYGLSKNGVLTDNNYELAGGWYSDKFRSMHTFTNIVYLSAGDEIVPMTTGNPGDQTYPGPFNVIKQGVSYCYLLKPDNS